MTDTQAPKFKTLTLSETYDFAATITLPASLPVSEYVGHQRNVRKAIRAGARVTITYHRDATNCTVYALRPDNTVIGRDFVATPAAVLTATGIDVKKG